MDPAQACGDSNRAQDCLYQLHTGNQRPLWTLSGPHFPEDKRAEDPTCRSACLYSPQQPVSSEEYVSDGEVTREGKKGVRQEQIKQHKTTQTIYSDYSSTASGSYHQDKRNSLLVWSEGTLPGWQAHQGPS